MRLARAAARLLLLCLTTLTAAVALAAPASAATACMSGDTATFAAADVAMAGCGVADAASEVNDLEVEPGSGGTIVFKDSNPIDDGDGAGGCEVSGTTATCPATRYVFDLGAGDDGASVGAVYPGGTSTGGDGDDELAGGVFGDDLTGGPGADAVTGGGGPDTLSGGGGADSVSGGSGDDSVTGGAGNDTVAGDAGADDVSGGWGDDTIFGGDGPDSLEGGGAPGCKESAGNDVLSGDGGDDALCGGAGLAGGSDTDRLGGGPGIDGAFYRRATAVAISLEGAANDGESGEGDNVGPDVENVMGGDGGDTLTGNDGPNVLDGGPGSDALHGLGGPDLLTDSGGDSAADTLEGDTGDDTLAAGYGPDVYIGGDGDDTVIDYEDRIAAVTASLDGQPGDGETGENDNLGPDIENVSGGLGDDLLIGNGADNELAGGPGGDTIAGGDGHDELLGQAGNDVLDAGSGRDGLRGGRGNDLLKTRDGETDHAVCGAGADQVESEARDRVGGDCERDDVAKPSPISIGSVAVTRAGLAVVRLECPTTERSCTGTLYVKSVRRIGHTFIKLAQLGYRLRGGQTKAYRDRIPKRDRRPLKRARRVKVRVVVTNTNLDTGDQTIATKLARVTTRGL